MHEGVPGFDFDLPAELIAQEPAARRDASRLLLVEPGGRVRGETPFADLPRHLRAGDLLVLNESRVLPARLWCRRADTGGRVEILLVEPHEDAASGGAPGAWRAMARPARRLRPGTVLAVGLAPAQVGPMAPAGEPRLTVVSRDDEGFVIVAPVEATERLDLPALAERCGHMPLPPYIRREATGDPREGADRERYQTVYAAADRGAARSVAAPTAGLHFTPEVLAALTASGVATARVCLHVGPGTFQPPTAAQVAARRLHAERFELPAATAAAIARARAAGGRVVAVGTTALRVLESVARLPLPAAAADGAVWRPAADERADSAGFFTGEARREAGHWTVSGTTRLFIAPPDRVTAADGLLTNFHLPGSSLLMLVAALAGDPGWREVYREAVARRLRFYSYGDCMLLLPGAGAAEGPSA
jgi:S-adenosylmethionine:tRNA ribosyltransferase-isomerase